MSTRVSTALLALLLLVVSNLALPTLAHANADALAFFQTNNGTVSPQAPAAAKVSRTRRSAVERSVSGSGPASQAVANLAAQHGVPQRLALAVCQVESRCRYGLVGAAGERGPLQIKLQTARGLGYSGGAAGLNGYAGAYWGMKHLAIAYRKCGSARGAAKLHNAGLASSCNGSGYASRVMARM